MKPLFFAALALVLVPAFALAKVSEIQALEQAFAHTQIKLKADEDYCYQVELDLQRKLGEPVGPKIVRLKNTQRLANGCEPVKQEIERERRLVGFDEKGVDSEEGLLEQSERVLEKCAEFKTDINDLKTELAPVLACQAVIDADRVALHKLSVAYRAAQKEKDGKGETVATKSKGKGDASVGESVGQSISNATSAWSAGW